MKKLFANLQNLKTQAGFTMIELLIVIAILGILAVAVLSAINPVEQINRGRDTGSRSDAEQLLSAIDRFNAFQGYYPWQTGAIDVTHSGQAWITGGWDAATDVTDTAGTPCPVSEKLSAAVTGTCVGSDELKVTFFSRIFSGGYNFLNIYNRGTQGDSTYICFTPKSKAFVTEAATRVAVPASLPADYPVADAVANTTNCGAGGNCVCLP